MFKKTPYKFKTYKSDAAPFFFFIDIFPPINRRSFFKAKQMRNNPIMPLPMRLDRVFNGENSIMVRPNEPLVFPIKDSLFAIINPIPFLQLGFEKLFFFTEIKSSELFSRSLKKENVERWWEATRYLYGNLPQIEEDFSAFLKAYLYTIIRAKLNGDDIVRAATEYCEIVNNLCKERLLRNTILVEINKKQENVKLFKEKTRTHRKKLKTVKKVEYHPELVDIEVFDLSETGFSNLGNTKEANQDSYVLKYHPVLFYDDLHECMLQNLKLLETNEIEMLDPSGLLEKNVILLQESENINDLNEYSWRRNFNEVNIGAIYNCLIK